MDKKPRTLYKIILSLIILVVVILIALLAYRAVSGEPLGLRSFVRDQAYSITSRIKTIMNSKSVRTSSSGEYHNIIFLHHSVGHNLIAQGNVRQLFAQSGYDFWDHDYNYPGLTNPDGTPAGYSYNIPDDNTDPDGLLVLFQQPVYSSPINAFSALLQHEVIIFKSCFPASNITSDEELETRKQWYLEMRDVMDQYPDKIFIVVTQPPLNPAETNLETAIRARAMTDWLASDEFLAGHANIFIFDFFDLLAESDQVAPDANMLKAEYRQGSDSHPNEEANQAIGPVLVDFVIDAIQQ